jgi:hypothetical protein
MGGAEALAGVAVKVLIEKKGIAPNPVALKDWIRTKDRAPTRRIG